ncbi:YdcF family protein [Pseudoalteromonas xiamenensis]
MFELKKIIGSLLMPLPFLLIALFILLMLSNKTRKVLWSMSLLCVISLWLISSPWFAQFIVAPLEGQYVAFNNKKHPEIDQIVVLGCDVRSNPRVPPNSQMGGCALSRIVEGIRILNLYPDAKLIVSGAGIGKVTNSSLMTKVAVSMGVSKSRISQNPLAKDTAEEAKLLAPKLVDRHVVLVTSVSHMKRAQDLFAKQGVETIPAPTEFASLSMWADYKLFIANAEVLKIVTTHIHEWVGLAWLEIVRFVDPEAM